MWWRGVRWYLVGSIVLGALGALAGCSGGSFLAEREPWRKEAEARCMSSGAVREGAGIVRISPIQGPGVCGAQFPLKVSSLGASPALGYVDEFRPPGSIPNAPRPVMPRWPVAEPHDPAPLRAPPPVQSRPIPPPGGSSSGANAPVSLDPPAGAANATVEPYDFRKPYGATAPARMPAQRTPVRAAPLDPASPAYDLSPEPYEQRRTLDDQRRALERPKAAPRYEPSPRYEPPPTEAVRPAREQRRAAPLGLPRAQRTAHATGTVSFSPAATLACPLVAALDRWIAETVQPSAMRWFGQPVIEIKQISAYSCRGMNGNPRSRISEHAFGNALDIASFTLADGRRITVKDGWRGSPEEQGFLRDVQGGACERFSTVLAPGSNVYHYDHFHLDLMRRANGRRACNPKAVSGEEVAARARATYARRGGDPAVTGSVRRGGAKKVLPPNAFTEEKSGHILPVAIPGEDGED